MILPRGGEGGGKWRGTIRGTTKEKTRRAWARGLREKTEGEGRGDKSSLRNADSQRASSCTWLKRKQEREQ